MSPSVPPLLHLCLSPVETPLTLAVQCEPGGGEAIRGLVLGGAHLDFRSKDGLTPLHKAVRSHCHTALLVNTHTPPYTHIYELKEHVWTHCA